MPPARVKNYMLCLFFHTAPQQPPYSHPQEGTLQKVFTWAPTCKSAQCMPRSIPWLPAGTSAL